MPAKGNNFFSPIGVAGPFEKALFARLPGGGWFVVAYGGVKILQSAKPVRLAAGGMLFCDEKWAKGFLGQDGDRLAAGRRFCRVQGRYAYPAGAYFCSCKSRQNTLGAVPQDPLTLKLRLDTNDVNIVRTAPQIHSQGACGAFDLDAAETELK